MKVLVFIFCLLTFNCLGQTIEIETEEMNKA